MNHKTVCIRGPADGYEARQRRSVHEHGSMDPNASCLTESIDLFLHGARIGLVQEIKYQLGETWVTYLPSTD